MRISDWSSDVCSSDLHRLEGAPAFDLARLRQVRWAVLLLGFAARHRALQPVHRRFALAFYLLARRRVVVDARRYLRCGKAGDAGYVGERHREYGAAPSGRWPAYRHRYAPERTGTRLNTSKQCAPRRPS